MMMTQSTSDDYSPSERRLVLLICALVTGVSFIDTTALNVALPFIQRDLNATATDTYWVLEIYLLGLAALMMAGGALGDSLGRRRPLRWGVILFALTSLGCALSFNAAMLIFFRALQGISAALMVPASLALINASFPPEERGAAIGKWSALVSLTIPLGPLFGGIAVDIVAWQAIFWVNIPLCMIVLWLMHGLRRPPFEPPQSVPLDIAGSIAITISLGLITFGLMEAGRYGFFTILHLATILAGLIMLVVFIIIETRIANPMVPPELFRNRRFLIVNLHTLVLFAAFQSATFFLSFMLVQSYGFGATQAGAAALPISILVTLLSRQAGKYTSLHGPRFILIISSVLMALAFALMSLTDGSYWQSLFVPMLILGLGVAAFAAPVTTVAMASAGPGKDGLASGVNNAVARIGPLLAIAGFGYVIAGDFSTSIETSQMLAEMPAYVKEYLIAHKNELGGLVTPADWPETIRQQAAESIAQSYADAVKNIMQISAFLMILCAFLALLYRKEDAV